MNETTIDSDQTFFGRPVKDITQQEWEFIRDVRQLPLENVKLLRQLMEKMVDDTFPGEHTVEAMQEWLDRHGWTGGWREMPS